MSHVISVMSRQSPQAAARPPRPGRRRSVAGGHRRGGVRRGGAGAKAVAAARWENRRKVNYSHCGDYSQVWFRYKQCNQGLSHSEVCKSCLRF